MEIMVFFSLMLLVCSVSTNQTEADNEIVDQQISNQQPCPQDIHAVLREMAVSLAEQKVEIRTLKQENQEQEAKLETEIDQLKQEQQVKQVAFSVSLLEQGSRDIGPFNIHMTLIFKRVVTNIGNAYNKHTGIFTAPVRGVYHFDWSIYGHGNIQTGAPLFRNGEHIFAAYEHPASGGVSASNGASLLLEVGDQVSVRLWANTRIYDNQNHHNTFSGHLIFTM
ncbi:complement C1q tumor necrosis factor-related protein 3 isoform X2 [Oreochromis niloticus]|uniref:Complement C1q tumor necrosis factor-related protein 3 n=1 Tax=Oreochromis niloticus TaxID=8128 RepID=A0A669BT18_ORENI|nr:complement C1q tumor necrosis factor-related protein 3 isoform X2 [Oreochromis niloticus]